MEPDTTAQEPAQEQEEEEEADPVMLAKKQKQLAKRGVTFEAKVDPKVSHNVHVCMLPLFACAWRAGRVLP